MEVSVREHWLDDAYTRQEGSSQRIHSTNP